jgi:peptide chain release factor 1
MDIIKHTAEIESRHDDLKNRLSDPRVVSNIEEYKRLVKAVRELEPVIEKIRERKRLERHLLEARELMRDSDRDIAALAREEFEHYELALAQLDEELKLMILPKDPLDEKNIIIEIRAGTGGEEAALFASDLFRMYTKYAESQNWKVETLSAHSTGLGGFKEIIFSVEGDRVYSKMKFESGTHRVQRVPVTEASGRIHTSAVTVAVLPEAEDVDVTIKPEELRIDVFRASGHGGQHVNVTDSAVRITHLPTGLVVSCQDEKSQHKNKAKALKVLRARLLEREIERQRQEISTTRRQQVGSGDRSERIRTYNFPQNRLSDHRVDLTLYKLEQILDGDLDDVINALSMEEQKRKLEEMAG